ncbi:alpha/beta hydrolase family protein [Alteromonas flava]|uniref:alpha/beta hydrolase family protein n=1 Tax=Alteromonas flava TaxID=2048003 RepID=UPI000C28F22A|nr:alpha/beta hydrolase [Alteromonas flava]
MLRTRIMINQAVKTILASAFLLSTHCALASESSSQYLHGVSFQQVTALASRAATTTLTYGEDENQFIEVWAAKQRPTVNAMGAGVILVHGGCWMQEYGIDHIRPLATQLSDDGLNVFAIEYRRTGQPGGGWPGSLNDVRNAIKKIRDTYPRKALTLIGHSAGGHLALLAATDATLRLEAVIGLAAITDITSYSQLESGCSKAAVAFMGGSAADQSSAYALADTRDKNIIPPLYLLTGKADSIVPEAQNRHPQSKRFHGENIGHFDWIHPGSEAYQHLSNTLGRLYE